VDRATARILARTTIQGFDGERRCYCLFGFLIESNRAIPGLIPVTSEHCDLRVTFGCPPPIANNDSREELIFTSSILTESGAPAFKLFRNAKGICHAAYVDGVDFWFDAEAGQLWAVWNEPLTFNDVAPYFLGPIMGLFLRACGIVCLHASGVVIQGWAVLFLGDPGAGKSTAAAAMSTRGHPLLADDIVAINENHGQFFATPAYPYISLWPDSAEMICGQDAKLPTLTSTDEKRRFSPASFQDAPVPLGCIFAIGERASDEGAPRIEDLSPREQLIALVANSYATRTLAENDRAEEFQLFGRMVGNVAIRRLVPHADAAFLERCCEIVEQDRAHRKPHLP
jgi:HPr Serine kinase C-terminal domain